MSDLGAFCFNRDEETQPLETSFAVMHCRRETKTSRLCLTTDIKRPVGQTTVLDICMSVPVQLNYCLHTVT